MIFKFLNLKSNEAFWEINEAISILLLLPLGSEDR